MKADPDQSSPVANAERATGIRAGIYWVLAGLFFVLAMVGVVLPGIPTTPFLLVMCYFLLRVSPALHARALQWPVVGGPLRDWREQGGVRTDVKAFACGMVTIVVGSTLIWSPLSFWPKAMIAMAAAYGVYFVIRLPTASDGQT